MFSDKLFLPSQVCLGKVDVQREGNATFFMCSKILVQNLISQTEIWSHSLLNRILITVEEGHNMMKGQGRGDLGHHVKGQGHQGEIDIQGHQVEGQDLLVKENPNQGQVIEIQGQGQEKEVDEGHQQGIQDKDQGQEINQESTKDHQKDVLDQPQMKEMAKKMTHI